MHDLDDPYPYFSHLRQTSPVHRLGDSSFYVVSSWALIADVVGRTDEFSSNLTAAMIWHDDGTVSEFPVAELGSPVHVLATADDPRHRDHRTMVVPSLVTKRVRPLAPFIAATLRRLWDDGLRDGQIDWAQSVSEQLPMAVVTKLLGLPTHDIDELKRWAFASTTMLDGAVTSEQLHNATAAVGELAGYLAAAFDSALREPGDDVLGDLARLVIAGDTDHDTAVMILIQLVAAGAESTISLLGTSVWLLARHKDIAEQLRRDPQLISPFIEESLRLESPFRGHFRHVAEDATLGNVDLPAGSHLYLAWGAANRDPEQFDDPDTINLDPTIRRSHMAFGKGIHFCVGAALARLESRIGIEFLVTETIDFDVDTARPQWARSVLSRRLNSLPMSIRVRS
ncbi:MAG: cytochrome P450 [Gordonia sp.]|nr:cytochrome P450 [Gordonia sp. (in: high G+C Gram-positive bacteria)]